MLQVYPNSRDHSQFDLHPIVPGAMPNIKLAADGSCSGAANGTYCISGKTITFQDIPDRSSVVEVKLPGGAYGSMLVVFKNADFEMELGYHPLIQDQVASMKLHCPEYSIWLNPTVATNN